MLVLGLSLFNAVVWRDTLYLNYAAYVLSVGLVQMTLTGVGGQFFWPHHAVWNDLASVILPTLSAAMLVMFIQAVVADHASTLIRGVFAALVVIGVALAGAFLLFDRQLVFGLVNAYFLLVFALSTAVLIRYALRQRGHAWWFVAGLVSLFIGALFPVLRNYGLLSVSVWTQYGAQMGAAIEIPLLLVGLHLRSRQRRDAHVRSSALDTRDAMTGLANDRTTRQNLHAMVLRMKHKVHGGCVMRVRLANYNAIVQEFGLQAVGIAMVRATSCVNEAIRTEDMAGRLKNGDFVIQLEGRLDEDKAMQTGAKIVARGLATNKAQPGNTTLKFHVALVVNPDGTQGADELLEQLDQLLASIARAPQRTVRVLRTVHVQAFRDSTLAPDDVA
jgi:diguanylate cyclase (GGDEF)-like protein